ncbi:MAG TPA: flavin reductase family protein, partial [Nitriliruptorales bacterium]|nr:flavin reductase family protein [Nitriliruptorales bacterium]
DAGGRIHTDHPFALPIEQRDRARRFRGRLAAPVTVWTAGSAARPAGLTISSLVVVQGDPARVLGLVNDLSDLWRAVRESGGFVVHVLQTEHRHLAERFAGHVPAPGGPFAGLAVASTPWGPALQDVPNRAYCRFESTTPMGYAQLVTGVMERVDLDDLVQPLMHFRGRYRPA